MAGKELSREEKQEVTLQLQKYLVNEHDLELGNLEAEELLDLLEETLGALYYNKGLKDASFVVSRKAEDISDELYQLERPTRFTR